MSTPVGFKNRIFQAGTLTADSQPCFFAYKSSESTNATGDGTAVNIVFDTEVYDLAANYNPSTGVFTAPITGKYAFGATIYTTSLGAGHTRGFNVFMTSNRNVFGNFANYAAMRDSNNALMLNIYAEVDMDAGDTCFVQTTVYNSTKTVSIFGQANTDELCWFAGHLMC